MQATAFSSQYRPALEANLAQLKTELIMGGAKPADPADLSLEKFSAATDEQQRSILDQITTYLKILAQETEPSKGAPNERIHEIARVKWALQSFGLKAMDSEIFQTIDLDDVIEVYNDQAIQLYRNIRFFKLCSYNLLDLAVNSWDSLYDKPGVVLTELMRIQEAMMTTATGTIPYNVGTFVQREKFIYAKTLRTFKVTPKYICPLVNLQSNSRAGFISTYSAEILSEGIDSLKINIL